MNYRRIYAQLINRAKNRELDQGIYFERHHILPRSTHPHLAKAKWNLVKLTAREHFIAHWLLHKMIPSSNGLALAFFSFNMGKESKDYRITARKFESMRKAASQAKKGFTGGGGSFMSQEGKARVSLAMKKRMEDPEVRLKISEGLTGAKSPFYQGATIGTNILTGETVRLCGKAEMVKAGFSQGCISRCLNGYSTHHKGYTWHRECL